jgi:hypothetical protein
MITHATLSADRPAGGIGTAHWDQEHTIDLAALAAALAETALGEKFAVLPFHSDATAALTLTNQVATVQGLGNSNRNESYFDASAFTEVRIASRVVTASASTASPRLRIEYSLNGTTWNVVGTDSGGDVIPLTPVGAKHTNWISIPLAARADVIWRIAQIGGDAVADPAVGNTGLHFR